jgi:hypothetical protein
MQDDDGYVTCSWNQATTKTGRLSSDSPNLQNIPTRTELGAKFRRIISAPPDYDLVGIDLSQIEYRVMAALQWSYYHELGDVPEDAQKMVQSFINQFNATTPEEKELWDIHTVMANLWGVPRKVGKNISFGRINLIVPLMQECLVDNVVNSVELLPHEVRLRAHRWRGQYRAKLEEFIVRAWFSHSSAVDVARYLCCRFQTVNEVWIREFGAEQYEARIRNWRTRGRDIVRGDGWFIDEDGYKIVKCVDGKWRKEHHISLGLLSGVPAGMVIHHLDGDKLNNDPSNLEMVSNSTHSREHALERVTTIPRGSNGQFIREAPHIHLEDDDIVCSN